MTKLALRVEFTWNTKLAKTSVLSVISVAIFFVPLCLSGYFPPKKVRFLLNILGKFGIM